MKRIGSQEVAAWWIFHIETKEVFVERLSRRGSVVEPSVKQCEDILAEHGYEMNTGLAWANKDAWPMTVCIYTSLRKDGVGRATSTQVYWPVRKLANASQVERHWQVGTDAHTQCGAPVKVIAAMKKNLTRHVESVTCAACLRLARQRIENLLGIYAPESDDAV